MTGRRLMSLAVLFACVQFCGASALLSQTSDVQRIPLKALGGAFVVPVLVNGQITLNFMLDSGEADVAIPEDVVLTLARTGTIQKRDFIGKQNYKLANGAIVPSPTFLIRSLKVGGYVVENVKANMSSAKGLLLLGQSFLRRFASWSVDNKHGVLLLNPKLNEVQAQRTCPAQLPPVAQHYMAQVTRFLTRQEALEATLAVEAQLGARVNPAYLRLRHVYARGYGQDTGLATVAAVPDHLSVRTGDTVELGSRYRDPNLPCHFIPWTVSELVAQP